MDVSLVLPAQVVVVWSELVPFINKFLAKSESESTLESIMRGILNHDYQCWVVSEDKNLIAVAITKIDTYEGYRALHIIGLAGGGWSTYKTAHVELEKFAKEMQCNKVSMWGRKGWDKMFQKHGFTGTNGELYKEKYVVMHMDLE